MQSDTLQFNRLAVWTIIICIVFIVLQINTPAKTANAENGQITKTDLAITDQNECASLGGYWNDCPPNECQKNPEYGNGNIICPQVCGSPLCDGIVPPTKTDLSTDHNPDIDHQLETDIPITNPENKPPSDITPIPQTPVMRVNNIVKLNLRKFNSINQKQIILYAALCVLLVIFFLMLKVKKRK